MRYHQSHLCYLKQQCMKCKLQSKLNNSLHRLLTKESKYIVTTPEDDVT